MAGFRKLNFVGGPPQELTCNRCKLVARDPHCSKCKCEGRLYCQLCIRELQNSSPLCSTCQQPMESFADSLSARHIRAIRVECDNRDFGCRWRGQLGELIDIHLQSCPLQVVNCPYSDIGCSIKIRRSEAQQHQESSTEHHLQLAAIKIQKLEAVILVPPIVFKLRNFKLRKARNERWNSPKFYSHQGGYCLCLSIDANGNAQNKGTHISAYVRLMKSLNHSQLVWPFRGEITIEMMNQAEDGGHFSKTILFDWKESDVRNSVAIGPEKGSRGWGYHDFMSHTLLDHNIANNTYYLKDDSIYIRVPKIKVYGSNKPWLTPTLSE